MNHQLTVNNIDSADQMVQDTVNRLEEISCNIPFSNVIRADIESEEERNCIDRLLPASQHGILTSVEEVTDVIMTRQNKSSTGDDNTNHCAEEIVI